MPTCTKCGEIDFDLYSEDEKRLRIDEMWTAESYGADTSYTLFDRKAKQTVGVKSGYYDYQDAYDDWEKEIVNKYPERVSENEWIVIDEHEDYGAESIVCPECFGDGEISAPSLGIGMEACPRCKTKGTIDNVEYGAENDMICDYCEEISDSLTTWPDGLAVCDECFEIEESLGAEGISNVPTATLGQSTNNPVRIIIGGPPHSGKSTLMSLVEDKMKQYGVSVELRDLDFSSPTDLKGAFDPNRKTIDWTPELAEDAANYFNEDSDERVILGDSIGLISRINEVVSEPADVAILLVSGSKNDNDQTYRDAIKKWQTYYEFIDMPILMVIRSSMNPEDLNYFDPHDNYGVMVGLDRPTYRRGDISLENTCLEGIVFEIAQEFDLGLANRSAKPHIEAVEAIWPEIKGKGTWNPIDAGKPHLGKIEDDYFSTFDERRREKNMN